MRARPTAQRATRCGAGAGEGAGAAAGVFGCGGGGGIDDDGAGCCRCGGCCSCGCGGGGFCCCCGGGGGNPAAAAATRSARFELTRESSVLMRLTWSRMAKIWLSCIGCACFATYGCTSATGGASARPRHASGMGPSARRLSGTRSELHVSTVVVARWAMYASGCTLRRVAGARQSGQASASARAPVAGAQQTRATRVLAVEVVWVVESVEANRAAHVALERVDRAEVCRFWSAVGGSGGHRRRSLVKSRLHRRSRRAAGLQQSLQQPTPLRKNKFMTDAEIALCKEREAAKHGCCCKCCSIRAEIWACFIIDLEHSRPARRNPAMVRGTCKIARERYDGRLSRFQRVFGESHSICAAEGQ